VASSNLKTWLAAGEGTLCWIDIEAYAHRVFAGAAPDWYRDPTRYAGALGQALAVIPTQCLTLDLVAPFLADHPEPAHSREELLRLLAEPAPASFLAQAHAALAHRCGDRVDLVLRLRAPRDLLAGSGDADASFDDLDLVATALLDLMRPFADKAVAGIVLECARGPALSEDEIDAYEPIVSAAHHYSWFAAACFPGVDAAPFAPPALRFDALLLPDMSLAALSRAAPGATLGGGLDAGVWAGASIAPDGRRLLYGRIPADAAPETVLAAVRRLTP
jgi:hypothetical protein